MKTQSVKHKPSSIYIMNLTRSIFRKYHSSKYHRKNKPRIYFIVYHYTSLHYMPYNIHIFYISVYMYMRISF